MASSSMSRNRLIRGFLKRIIGHPVGSIVPLTSLEVTIGRDRRCGITLNDVNISRTHCTLKYSSAGWTITDLGGVNGTYLNGSKLQTNIPAPLRDGMVIFLGCPENTPFGFVFMQNADGESSASNEDSSSSQTARSMPSVLNRDIRTSPFKREANPQSIGADASQRFRTELLISSSRPFSGSGDRLFCIVRSDEPIPGTSISNECGDSEHYNSRTNGTTSSARNNEPIPGPSLSNEQNSSEEGNVSDCSISSLDSLRTRIRKKQKRESQNLSSSIHSVAGPSVETSNMELDDYLHMFSPKKQKVTKKMGTVKGYKCTQHERMVESKSSASTQDTDSEDSESLIPINDPDENCHINKHALNKEQSNESSDNAGSSEQENTIQYLKERVLKLQKHLLESTLELKKRNDKDNEQKHLIEFLKGNQGISQEQLMKVLEDELCCNICTEILIKPTTLNCAHTFCEHCISVWKKKKKQCPMCRETITTEIGLMVLDNLISRAVQHLDASYQTRRSEIIQSRVEEKVQSKRRGGRRMTRRSSQIRIQRISNNFPVTSPNNPVPQTLQLQDFGRIEMVPLDVLSTNSQNSTPYPSGIEIQLSDGSDSSVEGSGYYGGFGRCYSCGRRGHWANGCPD